MTPTGCTGYLAADGFLDDLITELGQTQAVHGRLVLAEGPARPVAWAQNIWHDPVILPINSIKEGARALRALQRNWAAYEFHLHRRAKLIQDNLPHVSAKPVVFGTPAPIAPLGSWTLLDENTILAAPHCSSAFANGDVQFVEDKLTPPNRAYLKLWEAFTILRRFPQPGEVCMDLGSSPGGWTWVLQSLGAHVISVDKAPLAPQVARLPNITFLQQSAFALEPRQVGPVDWLCCDIICYPERLERLIETWRASGLVRNFICTIKFQGETAHDMARKLAEIPGSRVLHLFHNKHELTWINLADEH